ncbi:hypothetical protein M1146_04015 [Patescibacteria group bacterium]|nr:hypothetical protein [Patescibacteria group bacterium]
MISFNTKEAALAFVYPPKPVYPTRYLLASKDLGEDNDFESAIAPDFPEIELTKPHFAAIWSVKGLCSYQHMC